MSATTENFTVSGTGGACLTVTDVLVTGPDSYSVWLSGPIPPGHCTTLTFADTVPGAKLQYQSQPGNVNMDGLTNTQDLLRLIQLLNGANTTPAFNGAGVADCPD